VPAFTALLRHLCGFLLVFAYPVTVRIVLLLLAQTALAANFHAYVGQIESRSVLLAWGTTAGVNTIGRDSASMGDATVSIAGKELKTTKNWVEVTELDPNHSYDYSISVKGLKAAGKVRTFPEHASRLRFFVIGDYGNGRKEQLEVAEAMQREYQRLSAAGDAPRFVITTGDNIYADYNVGLLAIRSGSKDSDWESKFFGPYSTILSEIPFYPSPGNHDGNGSENRADLPVYLDNFFFPHNQPARWYSFRFADLAEFFSLDTTDNTLTFLPAPVFLENGKEFAWFRQAVAESKAPWKIPYFHHPPFNAGPYHPAALSYLKHFCDTFASNGVRVVFSGHEHNFQFSERDTATHGIEYVVSGAGGQLREGDIRGKMAAAHIAGWAAARHFLSVEIDGAEMKITPVGATAVQPVDAAGRKIQMPIAVALH
jgi:hypothetical protein